MPDPKAGGRWGILGGTFDPVHYGHLKLADQLRAKKNLDGVLLVPSYTHPFKAEKCIATYEERVTMLLLAVLDFDNLFISTIEKDKHLSGYTLDTIAALENSYSRSEFFFLIGADNISQLNSWHRPDLILEKIKVLAGFRPGSNPEKDMRDFSLDKSRIELVETELNDISSNEIRSLLKGVRDEKIEKQLEALMPSDVLAYIVDNSLYQ